MITKLRLIIEEKAKAEAVEKEKANDLNPPLKRRAELVGGGGGGG